MSQETPKQPQLFQQLAEGAREVLVVGAFQNTAWQQQYLRTMLKGVHRQIIGRRP